MIKQLIHSKSPLILGLILVFNLSSSFAAGFSAGVFEFQQKLANGGNAQAQYTLGTMYESGRGVEQNLTTAVSWYKKSAAQNYKAAKNRLVYLDVKQKGLKDAPKPWLDSLTTDARNGDGESLMLLGIMYGEGTGVKQNFNESIKLLKQAKIKRTSGAEEELELVEGRLLKAKQSRLSAEKARKEKAAKEQQAIKKRQEMELKEKQRAAQKARQERAEAERRKKLELQRQKAAEEKRRQEAQKAASTKAQPKAKAEDTDFESDMCKGNSARFLTACQ